MSLRFYALLPGLSSEIGHIYHYHVSVQKAVESIGWEYTALVPDVPKIATLPVRWKPILANDYWDVPKTVFFRLKMLFANILPFRKSFQSIEKDDKAIVFLEHFELQMLGALFLALVLLRPRFRFWILHRYVYEKKHFKTRIYRAFHIFLEKKMGKQQVCYLTDSDLLAELQKLHFQRSVCVVPIPHTAVGERIKKAGPVLFWWPGGSMREDKGLSVIRRFVATLGKEQKLVIAEKAKSFFSSSDSCFFVPTVLSSAEYRHWMQTADVVLLPYSSSDYAHRTSGIFVEAICFGSIPIVSQGTWMAYELAKYDLSELALNWNQSALPDRIVEMLSRCEISEKLAKMRAYYREFHSERGFAAALQQIAISS